MLLSLPILSLWWVPSISHQVSLFLQIPFCTPHHARTHLISFHFIANVLPERRRRTVHLVNSSCHHYQSAPPPLEYRSGYNSHQCKYRLHSTLWKCVIPGRPKSSSETIFIFYLWSDKKTKSSQGFTKFVIQKYQSWDMSNHVPISFFLWWANQSGFLAKNQKKGNNLLRFIWIPTSKKS